SSKAYSSSSVLFALHPIQSAQSTERTRQIRNPRSRKGALIMDDYQPIAPERGLRVTTEEYNALKSILEIAEEEDQYSGFEVEYYDGEAFVFAPEGGDWDELPRTFLSLLGWFITKNGLEYLAFGPGAAWGNPTEGIDPGAEAYCRIKSNRSLWGPKVIW